MKQKASILIVDDNTKNLGVLFNLLDGAGYEVLAAQNGETAVQSAIEVQPNLVLLDVLMPGIDGFETCRQLKANDQTKHIPVIFMTALSDTEDKVKGLELGAVDYITKPIHHEEVLARIRTHLTIQELQQSLRNKNQELKSSLNREKELNKIKSHFVSMASHELRTPISIIWSALDLLENFNDRMSDKEKSDMLTEIRFATERLNRLLDDILITSKVEAGKLEFNPEPLNLEMFCQKIVREFEIMDAQNHDLQFVMIGSCGLAIMDEKLLRHILSNLLSNALKYSPSGSPVYFKIDCRNGNVVTFQVKDEGIGIPSENQKHLFKSFYRADNVGEISGTGLGLFIVKQCVDLHSGIINVKSEVDKGTEFTVILPLIQDIE